MLMKLIKHELRATSRIMLPLFLLTLMTGICANFASGTLLETSNDVLNFFGVLLMIAYVLCIIASCMIAFFLMVQRFYKNLLQDEGYVMLTLPVSVHQHIWSKLLVSVLWFVLAAIVVVLSIVFVTLQPSYIQEMAEGLAMVREYMAANGMGNMTGEILLFGGKILLISLLAAACMCLDFYASMAVGHSFANHKILMSVAAFFGMQILLSTVENLFLRQSAMVTVYSGHVDTQLVQEVFGEAQHVMTIGILLLIACSAFYYAVTVFFMSKRLNLE